MAVDGWDEHIAQLGGNIDHFEVNDNAPSTLIINCLEVFL